MTKEVIVALITAGASFIVAVWGLLTARLMKSIALDREEHAKRGELVRVKALDAIQKFLDAVTELIVTVESLKMISDYKGGKLSIDMPEIQDSLRTIGQNYSSIVRLRISAALYLPPEILNKFDSTIKLFEPSIQFDNLEKIGKVLRSFAQSVSNYSRDKFLS